MNNKYIILFILLFTYTFAGWEPQISGTNVSLNDVYFPSDTLTGYICGDSGIILKTTNSGNDWVRQNTPVTTKLNAIYFIGDTGWCVGNHATFLMTTDGGITWEGDSTGSVTFNDVRLYNSNIGLIIGSNSIILRTFDGGRTWYPIEFPIIITLRSVFLINNSIGCVVGDSGSCWKTTDFGDIWHSMTVPTTVVLRGVYFVNNSIGYIVGDSGCAFRTYDGGFTWDIIALPEAQNLYGIDFEDENTGYVCGGQGFVSKFLHGQSIIINPLVDFYSINFPAPMIGWTVGSHGSIYKTSDGIAVIEKINKKDFSSISCFPNPFTDYLIVKIPANERMTKLKIYNALGKVIIDKETKNGLLRLNCKTFSKGVYFIKLKNTMIQVIKI